MTTSKPHVKIYTDGACKGNPGPGGWGVVLQYGENAKHLFGGEPETTNNRMEMTAVIEALKALKTGCQVDLFTDSQYVNRGVNEWLMNWKKSGWKTASKAPVKNIDLWQILDELLQHHEIQWHWVKGHSGDPGNELADDLANQGVTAASQRK
jgi:ribonuclease HI